MAQSVIGILNGVDYDEWNPATDKYLPANYSPDDMGGKAVCKQHLLQELGLQENSERPLIGIVTRLVGQKGIELILSRLQQRTGTPDRGRQRYVPDAVAL